LQLYIVLYVTAFNDTVCC